MANFLNTIVLLGAIQGFIVCCLLFCSSVNRQKNRLMGLVIALISLACLNLYGSNYNWFNSDWLNLAVQIVPLVIIMPIGPLLYFYLRTVLVPEFRIGKKKRWHFYPVILDLVPSLAVIIYITGVITKTLLRNPAPWVNFIDNYNVYADVPRWMSLSTYVYLSARRLSAARKKSIENNVVRPGAYGWLRQLLIMFAVFQVIWLLFLVPYILPRYTEWVLNTFHWFPIYIPMTVLIYWLGFRGFLLSQQQPDVQRTVTGNLSPIPPETAGPVLAALEKAMVQDSVFLSPQLNLTILAASTGFPPKMVSAVLNQHLQKSFNEYVNGFRVNAFKEKIMLPENDHLTMAGIAQQCGFNSQATFQRTFKEIAGISPSGFRKSMSQTF